MIAKALPPRHSGPVRFSNAVEAPIAAEWMQAIVAGRSEEAVKVEC